MKVFIKSQEKLNKKNVRYMADVETWYICAETSKTGEIWYRVLCALKESGGIIYNTVASSLRASFESIEDNRGTLKKYGRPILFAKESPDGKYLSTVFAFDEDVIDDKMRILYKEDNVK